MCFVAGINEWPGKQMHSHNYRVPEPFRDQVRARFGIGIKFCLQYSILLVRLTQSMERLINVIFIVTEIEDLMFTL